MATLDQYTRQLQLCRQRWNGHTMEFVLRSAKILQAARNAAKDEERWVQWLRQEAGMHVSTAYKHLRVASAVGRDFALRRNFATLSIAKVYALTRLKRAETLKLAKDPNVRIMSDRTFAEYILPFVPKRRRPPTIPNLRRSVLAGLEKALSGVMRWHRSKHRIPSEDRARIMSDIHRLLEAVATLRKASKTAVV